MGSDCSFNCYPVHTRQMLPIPYYLVMGVPLSKQQTMEVEGPRRALCQHKKPFTGPIRTEGSCWEEWKKIVIPPRGVIDFSCKNETENDWVSGKTLAGTVSKNGMLNQYTEEGYLDYSSKKMTGNMVANARYSTVIPGKRFSGCSLNTHEVWLLT